MTAPPRGVLLLRRLLRLHRRLPSFERQLGDSYVKHEFRLHRKVPDDKFLSQFYKQWESYADMLEATAVTTSTTTTRQAVTATVEATKGINGSQGDDHKIGQNLDKNIINKMSDEMVGQLYELHKATTGQAATTASTSTEHASESSASSSSLNATR